MAAYVIVDATVHDPEGLKAYGAKVGATLKAHGARLLVAGGAVDVLEGSWSPSRLVVLEFADADAARAWYNSPEYQELVPIRQAASDDNFIVVEGV